MSQRSGPGVDFREVDCVMLSWVSLAYLDNYNIVVIRRCHHRFTRRRSPGRVTLIASLLFEPKVDSVPELFQ